MSTRATQHTDGDQSAARQRVESEPGASNNLAVAAVRMSLEKLNEVYKRGASQPEFKSQMSNPLFQKFNSENASSRVLIVNYSLFAL